MHLLALSQASRLTLRLEQRQDVALTHGALHVADDRSVGVVEELHAHLNVRTRIE